MKTLFLLLLITFFQTIGFAQNVDPENIRSTSHHGYYELNFGAALVGETGTGFPFPGVSFLYGHKFYSNNLIIDLEIGVALPSIGTAKLGVGFKTKSSEVIFGFRPWPMHFYLQTQLNQKEKGGWILSLEVSPYTFNRRADGISMYSYGLINFGYRWNIRPRYSG